VIHTTGESFDARDGMAAIAVEPDSAVVTIPDAHFLFTADFKRKGPDLVLTGEDGRKMLVPDYFGHEKHPDLASPEGALLSAAMVELLSGSAAPGQYAQAGAPAAQQPVGRVETVTGSAQVVRNGVAIELNVGDLVFQGDVAQTRTSSTLAIAFSDGSAFTLNENARMALNEFVYDPNSTTNSAVINLVQGTVSFIAAQVAKTGNMRVETPTATLGIRGTFITVSVSSTDGNTVASLGLETNSVTGEQYSGVFTLTNKISGNQVTVSQVASMFSVSPAGAISESPKPPGIAALENATFQALIPVMNAAASFGATTTNQNLNLNPNAPQNPAPTSPQDSPSGQKGDAGPSNSPGPASGGSSGSNPADNKSLPDNHATVQLSSQPPPGDATPVNAPPANAPPVNPPPTNNPPANNPTTPADTHVPPTATVTNVFDTETPGVRGASFKLSEHVSVSNAGTPTGFVIGNAMLSSASVPSGLPSTLMDAAFLRSLLIIEPDGTVRYDSSKFGFLADGQSLSYTIAFDVKSGTDTLHLTLTFTVTGVNEAPTITVGPSNAATGTVVDDVHSTTLFTNGTLSFTDPDAMDGHSLSWAVKSGPAIGTFAVVKIFDTTGADPTIPGNAGDIGWQFLADKAHLQSLAAGETETEVFTISLSDGHGGTTSQDVSVTVFGVNDAPTITGAVATGSFSELANKTQDTADRDQASGTIAFADPDLTDTHTLSQSLAVFAWSGGALTAAQQSALATASTLNLVKSDSTGTAAGSVAWTYSITDAALDFLAAGETLTVSYTVTIGDGHGGTTSQLVTVTITGTNDVPTIVAGSTVATGAITELVNKTGSTDQDQVSGTIAFKDVDLNDTHTVSQAAPGFTWSGGALTDAQKAALTAASTLTLVKTDSTGTGTGSVAWTYKVADSAIDFLAQGETLTVTFNVTVTDNHGGSITQPLTVTIAGTGTNDTPVIIAASTTATGAITELTDTTASAVSDSIGGSIAFKDVDLDDTPYGAPGDAELHLVGRGFERRSKGGADAGEHAQAGRDRQYPFRRRLGRLDLFGGGQKLRFSGEGRDPENHLPGDGR
jgi:VCBS repeat-containing protein